MFFSGFFLDVSQLATPYRYISYLLPVTYGINMLHDVMLRGVDAGVADLDRPRRARRRLRFAGRAAAATKAAQSNDRHRGRQPSADERPGSRPCFNRRRIGRAVTVAAVVAAVTCVVGAVVAWQLLGDLRTRSAASLRAPRAHADQRRRVPGRRPGRDHDGGRLARHDRASRWPRCPPASSDGAAALDSVADLTEDIPPALDRLDTHARRPARRRRHRRLRAGGARRAADRARLRRRRRTRRVRRRACASDIRPIAEDLRGSTSSIRELSGSSDDLVAQLAALDDDLTELDESLERSTELLDSYRADTAEAIALAEDSLDDLDRDIALSRVLAVVLALSIAVGQVAPFHIGRQLAATPDPQPGQPDALSDL